MRDIINPYKTPPKKAYYSKVLHDERRGMRRLGLNGTDRTRIRPIKSLILNGAAARLQKIENISGSNTRGKKPWLWGFDVKGLDIEDHSTMEKGKFLHHKQFTNNNIERAGKTNNFRNAEFTWRGHNQPVSGVSFGPVSSILFSAGMDGSVRQWNTLRKGSARRVMRIGTQPAIRSMQVTHSGRLLAAGCATGPVQLWNPQIGKCIHAFNGHGRSINAVAFTSTDEEEAMGNSLLLASGSSDCCVRLWDPNEGHRRCLRNLGHRDAVISLDWAESVLASGSNDGKVRIWDIRADGENIVTLQPNPTLPSKQYTPSMVPDTSYVSPVTSICFRRGYASPSWGKFEMMTASKDGYLYAWDLRSPRYPVSYIATQAEQERILQEAKVEKQARRLSLGLPFTIAPDVRTKEHLLSTLQSSGGISSLSCSSNGQVLVVAGDDGAFQIWRILPNGSFGFVYRENAHDGRVSDVSLSPNKKYLASAGDDGAIRLWDIQKYVHAIEQSYSPLKTSRTVISPSIIKTAAIAAMGASISAKRAAVRSDASVNHAKAVVAKWVAHSAAKRSSGSAVLSAKRARNAVKGIAFQLCANAALQAARDANRTVCELEAQKHTFFQEKKVSKKVKVTKKKGAVQKNQPKAHHPKKWINFYPLQIDPT